MICIYSSDHLIIRLGMRKIDSLRSFDYPPWDEENVNLDEANCTCFNVCASFTLIFIKCQWLKSKLAVKGNYYLRGNK